MKPILFYLLQVIAASGLLYAYYHFALRNKRFHRYNRFYLLIAVVISSIIPFLNIPVYFSEQETRSSVVLQTLQVISSTSIDEAAAPIINTQTESRNILITENVVYLFYFFVFLFLLSRIVVSLNRIRSIIKKNTTEEIEKIRFINTDEPGTPFSFFRWLFWNRKIELHSEKGEQIFRHELFHIQQKHTWDIIFMELISIAFWINPFFHLMKKELKAIHEFLADEFAVHENKNWQYAELLLMQVFNTNNRLVNPFFHNQIKRRIAMITTSTKPSYQYLRKIMVLPIAVFIVSVFAFSYKNKKNSDPHEFERAINSITVVVDAGHGGTDPGVKTKDGKYTEAMLALQLAKMIESLAHEYNINVIMTRENNNFPGNATNNSDALRKRVDIVNNVNPNAFVAIHLNTTNVVEQNSYSGMDGYVTKQRYNIPDIQFASVVLAELNNIYTTRQEIKQREDKGIFIIDKPTCPSLLLECGYINNPKDLSFIIDVKNQEKIARAILKGVVAFANKSSAQKNYFPAPIDTSKLWNNALVVINGVIQEKRGLRNVDTTLFPKHQFRGSSVTILGKEAINKYGEKGKDGVIEFSFDASKEMIVTKSAVSDTVKKPQPLLVINGKPMPGLTTKDLDKMLSPSDIESMNILMADTAINKYGEKGKNGVIEIVAKNIKEIETRPTTSDVDNIVFEKVEIEASFPEGVKEWRNFLTKNLDINVPLKNKAPKGTYTVVLQHIVDKEGNVSNIKTLTNHGYGMEEEAIRVMKLSPKWNPAMQNGLKVKAYRKQPVTFVIRAE